MRLISSLGAFAACLLLCQAAYSAPVIQGVQNAASFQPAIASGTWIAITGTNLATTTRAWRDADFTGANLPVQLDDVQVSVNGRPAYIYFISPGQINVLGPDDPAVGSVAVQVTNAQGASNAFTANKLAVSPALFAYPQLGGRFGVMQTGSNLDLVGPPRMLGPTATTTTASPGSSLVLYGTGFGPVNPPQASGQLVLGAPAVVNPVTVSLAGQDVPVLFAGLISSGLYQIDVVVPELPSGDAPLIVSVGGRDARPVSVPIQAFGHASRQSSPALAGCLTGQVDSIGFDTSFLSSGQALDASIGGKRLCSSCSIQAPLYPEFTARLERALEDRQTVQACYDKNGLVFQLKLVHH